MITYDDLTEYAPPASDKAERDAWFADHGFDVDSLVRMAREVAEYRLANVPEGAVLTANDLILALATATLFGFELAVRVERDEKTPLTVPPSNGNGSS